MQVHKKLGSVDDNAAGLTGNAAYWAKRMPRTFARSGARFVEEQKQEQEQKKADAVRVIRQTPSGARKEALHETIERRERQRSEVIGVLSRVKRLTVADIIVVVSYITDVPRERIVSTRREKKTIAARMAVSALAKFWGYSFSHIGRCINRDHGTVMYHWEHYGENIEAQLIVEKASRMLRFQMGKK